MPQNNAAAPSYYFQRSSSTPPPPPPSFPSRVLVQQNRPRRVEPSEIDSIAGIERIAERWANDPILANRAINMNQVNNAANLPTLRFRHAFQPSTTATQRSRSEASDPKVNLDNAAKRSKQSAAIEKYKSLLSAVKSLSMVLFSSEKQLCEKLARIVSGAQISSDKIRLFCDSSHSALAYAVRTQVASLKDVPIETQLNTSRSEKSPEKINVGIWTLDASASSMSSTSISRLLSSIRSKTKEHLIVLLHLNSMAQIVHKNEELTEFIQFMEQNAAVYIIKNS